MVGGKVEEEESVEGEGDGDVVDKGGVHVALAQRPVPVVVQVQSLEANKKLFFINRLYLHQICNFFGTWV